jgi:protoporphyrinogen oxidase
MKEWLLGRFGPTLCDLFFHPFHDRYTAGLHERIAPQDGYKSMRHLGLGIQGASPSTPSGGYNATFVYPREGLDALASRMADRCDLRSGRRVVGIDLDRHVLYLTDGTDIGFQTLISTLPLNRVMDLAALKVEDQPDPHTSVLVLNLGAAPGPNCPDAHWVYVPDTASGFHRVGFYSNVDRAFLPRKARPQGCRVSLYVERAYLGERPSRTQVNVYARAAVAELQDWGYLKEVDVMDPTWIDVAYTWAWPESRWRADALRLLEAHGIYQVGRYARWQFQGIAESIRDGLVAGASFGRA